jgi:hypothetical protein
MPKANNAKIKMLKDNPWSSGAVLACSGNFPVANGRDGGPDGLESGMVGAAVNNP